MESRKIVTCLALMVALLFAYQIALILFANYLNYQGTQ
jgi:hypothetical protein